MKNTILRILGGTILFFAAYFAGSSHPHAALAQGASHAGIPKSYGHLVGAVVNPTGTALVFEDSQGAIRCVTITGKLEAEITRN